jgi:hypothetical protein
MKTRESLLMSKMLGASSATAKEAPGAFGSIFFAKARTEAQGWPSLNAKPGDSSVREVMKWALENGTEIEVAPIGRGIHRPYMVKFKAGMESGFISTKQAALKTMYCQLESKRYCKSVDLKITGPERECLSYDLDQALGFDLVPPTVFREVAQIGSGSVQAWVAQPTAFEWIERGYDYRKDVRNPWLHRLASFDFISGQIDRHSNNWVMDDARRVYAIDNGYSFVKEDDRSFLKSSAGKHLVGQPLHPLVRGEIMSIDEDAVLRVLEDRGFENGEVEGVIERIQELKGAEVWTRLGELW